MPYTYEKREKHQLTSGSKQEEERHVVFVKNQGNEKQNEKEEKRKEEEQNIKEEEKEAGKDKNKLLLKSINLI